MQTKAQFQQQTRTYIQTSVYSTQLIWSSA